MKTYVESGCNDPRILDLNTCWWVVSFTPRPLYPRGKAPATLEPIWTLWSKQDCLAPAGNRTPARSYPGWGNRKLLYSKYSCIRRSAWELCVINYEVLGRLSCFKLGRPVKGMSRACRLHCTSIPWSKEKIIPTFIFFNLLRSKTFALSCTAVNQAVR
jgi:hypothetical protein